jgi:hypothetical protein
MYGPFFPFSQHLYFTKCNYDEDAFYVIYEIRDSGGGAGREIGTFWTHCDVTVTVWCCGVGRPGRWDYVAAGQVGLFKAFLFRLFWTSAHYQ